MMKTFRKGMIGWFAFLSMTALAVGQPYRYFIVDKNVSPINSDVYRTNLATGTTEVVMPNLGNITNLLATSDQSRLFLTFRSGVVEIVQPDNFGQATRILGGVEWIYDLVDAPGVDRIFIRVGTIDESRWIVALNRSAYAVVDSVSDIGGESYPMFLSGDGTILYAFEADSATKELSLISIQTSTSRITRRVPFAIVGPNTVLKAPVAGEAGNILIAYELPTAEIQNQYFVDYDLATGLTHTAINFPWIADAYLSSDARHIILNRRIPVISDTAAHEGFDYYPGEVYVFNALTGDLEQHLTLPPGGRILSFADYPGTFYYYNDSTDQSVTVSASVVTPSEYLIDSLISMKHQAVANGWLKVGMGHVRDIDEAMRPDRWYDESAYRHYRKWHPDKSWDFDRNWNSGIIGILDKRLEKAKQALAREDSVTARRDLEIFVMEVEVVRNSEKRRVKSEKSVMTSEAYTLLKYNAEYIIDRLPERQVRQEEGQRRKKK